MMKIKKIFQLFKASDIVDKAYHLTLKINKMYQMVNNLTVKFNGIFQSYPDYTEHNGIFETKINKINELDNELSELCLRIVESNIFDKDHKWFDFLNKEIIKNLI